MEQGYALGTVHLCLKCGFKNPCSYQEHHLSDSKKKEMFAWKTK